MNRSLIGLLIACLGSVSVAACTQQPGTFILDPDGDDDGEGAGNEGGATSATTTVGSGSGATAQEMFINQVYPAIQVDCASCHTTGESGAPVFLAGDAAASYNAITGYAPSMIAVPENSNLVLHGAHTGPGLTASQLSTVSAWLNKEAEERGLVGGGSGSSGSGTPTGKTLEQAMDEFANCMELTDWEMYMANLPNAQTGNAGACLGCHTSGDGGAYLSTNVQETFDQNREFPYIRRLVTGTVNSQGAFEDLIPSNRFLNKGLEAANCNPNTQNCHPVYNLPPTVKTNVELFVSETLDRWKNNQCAN